MPTLEQALATYLRVDRSPQTNLSYRRILTRMATAIGPARDICLITYADLVDYTAKLKPDLKQSTFVVYLRAIKTFFDWAVRVVTWTSPRRLP